MGAVRSTQGSPGTVPPRDWPPPGPPGRSPAITLPCTPGVPDGTRDRLGLPLALLSVETHAASGKGRSRDDGVPGHGDRRRRPRGGAPGRPDGAPGAGAPPRTSAAAKGLNLGSAACDSPRVARGRSGRGFRWTAGALSRFLSGRIIGGLPQVPTKAARSGRLRPVPSQPARAPLGAAPPQRPRLRSPSANPVSREDQRRGEGCPRVRRHPARRAEGAPTPGLVERVTDLAERRGADVAAGRHRQRDPYDHPGAYVCGCTGLHPGPDCRVGRQRDPVLPGGVAVVTAQAGDLPVGEEDTPLHDLGGRPERTAEPRPRRQLLVDVHRM